MLAVKTYPQEYIDRCRAQMDAQLAAYTKVRTAAGVKANAAVQAFEPRFFENLTLVLDHFFMHRTRAIEGKDGNPLNEVRMLCTSILEYERVFTGDKTIKYEPDSSVLELAIGDEIRLDEAQFRALSKAYFAEIEAKLT